MSALDSKIYIRWNKITFLASSGHSVDVAQHFCVRHLVSGRETNGTLMCAISRGVTAPFSWRSCHRVSTLTRLETKYYSTSALRDSVLWRYCRCCRSDIDLASFRSSVLCDARADPKVFRRYFLERLLHPKFKTSVSL